MVGYEWELFGYEKEQSMAGIVFTLYLVVMSSGAKEW